MIEFKNVSKVYQTKSAELTAVQDVSLKIKENEVFGIIGFSGAGKSTLVRMMNGLEIPTSGELIINGKRNDKLSKKELRQQRQKIGMIFQHFNLLWSRTVLENIMFPLELGKMTKSERIKKAKHLAELVGLEDRIDAYPAQLSGGQKQRVGIARALANDPAILISDEATSALDPQTTDEVLTLLANIKQKLKLTIVIITHEMHVIRRLADRVAIMEKGRVIEEGTVAKVFTQPEQELTRKFVNVETDTAPAEDVKHVISELLQKYPEGQLLQLKFHGDQVKMPIVSEMLHQFPDLQLSILQGSVHQLQNATGSIGSLFVQLIGNEKDIKAALEFLNTMRVETEVYKHE
ncbi:methionine ABC transporter ATP-binding protein [Liquorilactobacillus capillatus]|uniref:ABC superfamily ATP binding cassette transporter, ABC protein n=1 Tax=Liquorilactobacillus capillatus DSM 19910 TaxID=1423731 RepID=A0A0R1LYX7_9LACO|nr:methionine ABC transporter ATP-binding protein [Liquorilactobacillus capillatus]KRL00609.1 ABC superfamily ATP binding cassette transporter, ABC protein [Liquorilactobacillus capillatus DSM 19910]